MTVSKALEFDADANANEEWKLAKKELRALTGYRGKGLYNHVFTRKQVPEIAESIEFWKGVKVNDYMYLDPAYLVRARALVEKNHARQAKDIHVRQCTGRFLERSVLANPGPAVSKIRACTYLHYYG